MAYWLFWTITISGRRWMLAQFSPSWKSPCAVAPSPRQVTVTSSSAAQLAREGDAGGLRDLGRDRAGAGDDAQLGCEP